jgi:hypothetical protein
VAKARPRQEISWLPWWLRSRVGRWLLRSTLLLLLVAAIVGGVIWLGRFGLGQIHDQDRFKVPLTEVACDVPEGMERTEFLDQVQYSSPLATHFNVLDDDLSAQVRLAFARHPWVEKVDGVKLTPPRSIAVSLVFRVPVLAVRWDEELRAVDGSGVLLPKNAPTRGLPVYEGVPRPPRPPPGTRWGDSDLENEARRLRAGKK